MNILNIYPAYRSLLVIWVMAIKDIRSSLTERAFMVTSIIIPINFLLLFLLFALTGGQAPTAIVLEDKGPYAQQILSAMEHSFFYHPTNHKCRCTEPDEKRPDCSNRNCPWEL